MPFKDAAGKSERYKLSLSKKPSDFTAIQISQDAIEPRRRNTIR
jgi:hypothetical protein